MTEQDIIRLKAYSDKNSKGKTNELYSSNHGQIDTGFLLAKMIKHAFRTYPKVRTAGVMTVLETEAEAQEVDYGIEMPKIEETTPVTVAELAEEFEANEVHTSEPVEAKAAVETF